MRRGFPARIVVGKVEPREDVRGAVLAESTARLELEGQKRRSSRLVQAVPLTISGVDALGRQFEEHTETVIISCHGCRYLSKHYVLKNMWVLLEVPHTETGQQPCKVRARVSWIQRPRTVRELFQIGVELETSGNFWGLALPPGDWLPHPDLPAIQEISRSDVTVEADPPEGNQNSTGDETASPVDPAHDNVRIFPLQDGGNAPGQRPAQVVLEAAEAKQQLQNAVQESAKSAMGDQTQSLIAEMEGRLKEAVDKSIESAISAQVAPLQSELRAQLEIERDTRSEKIRVELSAERDLLVSEARAQFETQIRKFEQDREETLDQQIQKHLRNALAKLDRMTQGLDENSSRIQAVIEQLQRDSEAALETERQRWQERLSREETEAQARIAHLETVAKSLANEISVATTASISGWRALLDGEVAGAQSRWELKVESSIGAAMRAVAERLAASADASSRMLEEQIQGRVASLGRLVSESLAGEESRLDSTRNSVISEMRADIAKRSEELEQKATATTQNAFETLNKTVEWCEKKVQTQMQSLLDRGLEQASAGLRDKAGELSGLFASELGHYSRSFMEHSQTRIEENIRNAVERARLRMEQASDAAIASFADRSSQLSVDQLSAWQESVNSTLAQQKAGAESRATEVRLDLEKVAESLTENFHRVLARHTQGTVARGGLELMSQMDQAKEGLRLEGQSIRGELQRSLESAGMQSLDEYRRHLENISNSWLLTTASRLHQQSEGLMEQVAASTEKKLRSICADLFAEIGETLRDRLAGLATPAESQNPALSRKTASQVG
jgi:hypothetical protein